MGVDHIMVGGLTAASIALLVWIEIRSRRNSAGQEGNRSAPQTEPGLPLNRPRKKNSTG
jgi:hypothetical protein